MSDVIQLSYGQRITVADDLDGYPAVRIDPSRAFVTTEDDVQWVTTSSTSHDAEDKVREMADALVKLADRIKVQRAAERSLS